ncbi:MAG: hypothetical protein ACTSQ8_20705 [Candidatus Helarchaeota archaeon]
MALHIAISTGQNITNVIPIREMAHPGDEILFIESETAHQQKWTERACRLLEKEHVKFVPSLCVSDAEQIAFIPLLNKLRDYFKNLQLSSDPKIYFYLNGGQKIAAVAVWEALRNWKPVLVYMDARFPALQVSDPLQQKTILIPIQRKVKLQEILILHDSVLREPQNALPSWDPLSLEHVSLYQEFQENAEFIQKIYARMVEKSYYEENKKTKIKIPPDWREEFEQFKIRRFEKHLLRCSVPGVLKKYLHFNTPNRMKNFLIGLIQYGYSQHGQLEQQFLQLKKKKIYSINGGARSIPMSYGTFFEYAVLYRFLQFLQENPEYKQVISEIWLQVKIGSSSQPQKDAGEYDILLVMKNGMVITLECKTFQFQEKDLFSRLARLMQRTGILNEIWVVFPFFTEKNLFAPSMEHLFKGMQMLKMKIIPFGRKHQYAMHETEEGEIIQIPEFEDQLKKYMQRFLIPTKI